MINDDLIPFERWKDIPLDTKFCYQASDIGRISHVYPSGHRRILSECYVKSLGGFVTGLTMSDGSYQKFQTVSLVAKTWLGVRPSQYQAIHRNGIKSDHRLSNIVYINRKNIGKIANAKKRKAVLKINKNGDIVEIYKSAKDASDKNAYSYSAIKNRCRGCYKDILGTDGYAYCYEDDEKMFNKILERLESEYGSVKTM